MNNEISLFLRLRRHQLGYTQAYVASSLSISQQSYSRIENKPLSASLEDLLKICDIVQISFEELFMKVNSEAGLVQNKIKNGNSPTIQSQEKLEECFRELMELKEVLADSIKTINTIPSKQV